MNINRDPAFYFVSDRQAPKLETQSKSSVRSVRCAVVNLSLYLCFIQIHTYSAPQMRKAISIKANSYK